MSDIAQLARLQATLGSISLAAWPEAATLPDWGKICFEEAAGQALATLLPRAPPSAVQLIESMLR